MRYTLHQHWKYGVTDTRCSFEAERVHGRVTVAQADACAAVRHAVNLGLGGAGYLGHLHLRVATPIDDPGVLHRLLQYTQRVVQAPLRLI